MTTVLVVDDDGDIRAIVERSLSREGFQVVAAGSAEAALEAMAAPPDMAILDVHLPGMSGYELLAELRIRNANLHVIMLTGEGSEPDRVLGLLNGADDYVAKPFSVRELAARAVAARRRYAGAAPAVLEAGDLHMDLAQRVALVAGEAISLTRREFDLLRHLASHPATTFTRSDLLASVWSSSAAWQGEATVTEHVRRLRAKIEADPRAPKRILTVRPFGYRFEPQDERDAPASDLAGLSENDCAIIVIDGRVVAATALASQLVGCRGLEVVGRNILDFVAPRSVEAAVARMTLLDQRKTPRPEVMNLRRSDDTELLAEVASVPVNWNGHSANRVTLWDLSNDAARLQELATGIRSSVSDAVIITDGDFRIQSFNQAAEALYGLREDDVVGRTMNEVAASTWSDGERAAALTALEREGRWYGQVTQRLADGSEIEVLSAVTLLRSSAGGVAGVVAVTRSVEALPAPTVDHQAGPDAALEAEIRRGIREREFVVHYQPVVSLDDAEVIGVEALVRWQHPARGLLPPGAFIDVAEQSGLIVDLGQFVLDEACSQGARWARDGRELYLSVNLSGRQLADPTVYDRIVGSLARSGLPPEQLWLEVTETSLVRDLEQAAAVLRRIAALGVEVSIDDFGTGWASLTYLREFPIGCLKIDRLFVNGLATGAADAAIIASIVSLGVELDLLVTAEGIETEEQRATLRRLGCVIGQGYLFGRPVPPADLFVDG